MTAQRLPAPGPRETGTSSPIPYLKQHFAIQAGFLWPLRFPSGVRFEIGADGQQEPTTPIRFAPMARGRANPDGADACPGRSRPADGTRTAVQLVAGQRQCRALGLRLGSPPGAVCQPGV
ncbi:hypothetical protein EMIT0196P_150085 [Pseudomonas chlororaphis]